MAGLAGACRRVSLCGVATPVANHRREDAPSSGTAEGVVDGQVRGAEVLASLPRPRRPVAQREVRRIDRAQEGGRDLVEPLQRWRRALNHGGRWQPRYPPVRARAAVRNDEDAAHTRA